MRSDSLREKAAERRRQTPTLPLSNLWDAPPMLVSADSSPALGTGGSRTLRRIQTRGEWRKDGTHSGSQAPSPGHIQAGSLGSGHRNWPRASSPGKRCDLGVGLFPCEGSCSPSGACSLLLSNLQAAICWWRTLATPGVRLIPGKQPVCVPREVLTSAFWGASLPAGRRALPLCLALFGCPVLSWEPGQGPCRQVSQGMNQDPVGGGGRSGLRPSRRVNWVIYLVSSPSIHLSLED